ncbi:MAG: BamA/TamA family outer membrane protein, partial [Deltaproteobacteria bacterium]|nr:BamA/TamA family outer membrane protein [Deltaproteobacteria bacterium]
MHSFFPYIRFKGTSHRESAGPSVSQSYLLKQPHSTSKNPNFSLKQTFLLFFIFLTLASCGGGTQETNRLIPSQSREAEALRLLQSDPHGPIPPPNIPKNLRARDLGLERDRVSRGNQIDYTVLTVSPNLEEAKKLFEEVSELFTLKDKPINSPLALTQRIRASLNTGTDILKSLGYFEGKVLSWTEIQNVPNLPKPIPQIVVNFEPGPLYRIGPITYKYINSEGHPLADQTTLPHLTLEKLGLKAGDPALAKKVLQAVGNLPEAWANVGYPFAEVTDTRFVLDTEKKLLEITVTVLPGEFIRVGDLQIIGESPVKREFILYQVTWKHGEPWNQEEMDRFRDALFQKGLFLRTEVNVGKTTQADGTRPVELTLQPAPMRTISGSVNYDSDFGPGVELSWEHRNLTGWGDDFQVDLPLWRDLQQLGFKYTRPYIFSRRNNFLASSAVLHEKSDSYTLKSISATAGLERQFSRYFSGTLLVKLEAGTLNEFILDERHYRVWGFPTTLTWNWSDNFMDPTQGTRLIALIAPYGGFYFNNFHIMKARLDAFHYFSIIDDGKLVFALRGTLGNISGASSSRLPSSLRFFSGGGGSVRGYEYQSIGPRNAKNKPSGGNFLNEIS